MRRIAFTHEKREREVRREEGKRKEERKGKKGERK